MFKKISESRICAFCQLPHRVYLKKEVSIFDVILLLVITGVLALAIWEGPDLRSLLIFMTLAFILQVFLRVRYRESVKCPHCGFDPILYNHQPEQAAQRVKSFMESRKDNPQYMLRPQPRIPVQYKTREQIEKEKLLMEGFKSEGELQQASEPQDSFLESSQESTPF
jgi:hypothetical protein